MSIDIKHIDGETVLYTAANATDVRTAVAEAVKNRVDLRGAYLRGAYLRGANLGGANLRDANLRGAKNAEYVSALTVIAPEGDIIGWKALREGLIAKLRIPADAKRSNATGRKCRAEYAEVLEVVNAAGNAVAVGYSQHDRRFEYRAGDTVRPHAFDDDRWNECAPGIHFFITRAEAEAWRW